MQPNIPATPPPPPRMPLFYVAHFTQALEPCEEELDGSAQAVYLCSRIPGRPTQAAQRKEEGEAAPVKRGRGGGGGHGNREGSPVVSRGGANLPCTPCEGGRKEGAASPTGAPSILLGQGGPEGQQVAVVLPPLSTALLPNCAGASCRRSGERGGWVGSGLKQTHSVLARPAAEFEFPGGDPTF